MEIEATPTGAAPGMRHWLLQLVPPLLMLGIFFVTEHGTSLVFLAGLLVIPVLISVISIIVKLVAFNRRKYHLPRPLLTLAVFGLILWLANLTYQSAHEQAVGAARAIQRQCVESSACPEIPAGWDAHRGGVARRDFGAWLNYSASYRADGDRFGIRLYRGPDTGDTITGGVDTALDSSPYRG